MTSLPGVLVVVDSKKEHIAVGEARKLGIPVIGIIDTNCDPDDVDVIIPDYSRIFAFLPGTENIKKELEVGENNEIIIPEDANGEIFVYVEAAS